MESLVSESLHKVAAVLCFEPTSRTPGMNAATVRDAFTQRKRRCLALAAANIGQAEEDIEGLHRQGVRGHEFTFESERVKKSRRQQARKAAAAAALSGRKARQQQQQQQQC